MQTRSSEKVFVTHAVKVVAPVSMAWTTHQALQKYLNNTPDQDRPIQLCGVLYAGMMSKDALKVEIAALITLQNKRLAKSTAVQVTNVWKTDTEFTLTDDLVVALSTGNLDTLQYQIRSV